MDAAKVIVPPQMRLWAQCAYIGDHSFCIAVHALRHLEPHAMVDLQFLSVYTGQIELIWSVGGGHFWNLHDLLVKVADGTGTWHHPNYPYLRYEFGVTASGPRYDELRALIEKGERVWRHEHGSFLGRHELSLIAPSGHASAPDDTIWVTGQCYSSFRESALWLASQIGLEADSLVGYLPTPPPPPTKVSRWKPARWPHWASGWPHWALGWPRWASRSTAHQLANH